MKSFFKFFFVMAAASATIIACNKEASSPADVNGEDLVEVTIIAGNPLTKAATRTEIEGLTPYWSVGDAIGVSNGSTNYKFTTEITSRSATASFKGTTSVSSTLYAYYPYTSNGVNEDNGAKVDLPATQKPTVNSFDGNADLMVAKAFTVDPENTTVENLEFMRLGAIVKLVLKDKDNVMTSQHPNSVSLTAESNLVGRVYIDMVNQQLGELYYGQSKTVTAEYTSDTKYVIDGTNATYFVVYPQTIAAGTKLTVAASTEGYSIAKEITVPSGGIVLEAGKITTLNISLLSSHITASAGASLPFEDDMSWADNGTSDSNTDISSTISTESNGLYIAGSKAYKGIGGLKLGSSSAKGYVTTKELNLTGAFYIAIEGAQWDNGSNLVVSVDETEVINEAFAEVNYVNIPAGTYSSKSKVTIGTSAKRGRIYSVTIASGEYTAPAPTPVINVTSANPMKVTKDNDLYSIEYTISNATEGTSISAASNVAWIHDFDYSTDGEVVFEVDAQESGAASRSGVITLSYTGATDVEVTVNQAGDEPGTQSNPYTVAGVRAYMDASTSNRGPAYIKGIISSIQYFYDASHATATFFISDDGETTSDQFEAYSVKFLENKVWANGNSQIAVGDNVVIYGGELTIYNETIYETKSNSYLYSLNGTTSETVPTITKTDISNVPAAGVSSATTSVTFADNDGWTARVTPDGTIVTVANISGNTITYSVAQNTGNARTGSIEVTLSKSGRTDVSATISVQQAQAAGADALVYTLTAVATGSNGTPHNAYDKPATVTIEGIDWSVTANSYMVPWRFGGKSLTNVDREFHSMTKLENSINKIDITNGTATLTVNSMTLIVASDSEFANVVSTVPLTFVAGEVVTANRPSGVDWTGCYYKVVYNVTTSGTSNQYVQFVKAEFYGKSN